MAQQRQFLDMVERFASSVRGGDRDAIKAMYARDIVSCDATPPLCSSGKKVVEDRLDSWMGQYEGAMGCEIAFGDGAASGDVGYCHFLERITGRTKKGNDVDMWVRVTWCMRKIEQDWRIAYQHASDPFDPETTKAQLGLKP